MNLISEGSAVLLLLTAVGCSFAARRSIVLVLLTASVAFYAASMPGGLPWLLLSTAGTYWAGRRLPSLSPRGATWLLAGAITAVLAALVIVKLPGGSVVAPLGISYVSFRLIAYLLDVYWGRIVPASGLPEFLAFAAFFPQVTSGPIQRWEDFHDQIDAFEVPGYPLLVSGMRLILWGLFKKIVVANRLGALVDPVFDSPGSYPIGFGIVAAYAFPLQLYADFSGLTDIARGSSRLIGIESPRNFASPFAATSVQEFWGRWHMSLTQWLRDYLFKPMSLALRGAGRAGIAFAASVNMLAIGLWHGLKWTFLVFGLLNAAFLVVGMLLPAKGAARMGARSRSKARTWAAALWTYQLMALAFVFFRADDLSRGVAILARFPALPSGWRGAFGAHPSFSVTPWGMAVPVVVMFGVEWAVRRGYWARWFEGAGFATAWRWTAYYATLLAIIFLGVWGTPDFIYARF